MIIADVTDIGFYFFLLRVNPLHFGHAEGKFGIALEYFADGVSNAVGFEAPGSHLVQQRLESMVVVAVQHDNLELLLAQLFSQCQSCKTATNDDYSGVVGDDGKVSVHIIMFSLFGFKTNPKVGLLSVQINQYFQYFQF